MPKFIRVTKDNQKKDRGFIAVDAICAVFENQEAHNTEIMTMDGFWYEVVDGIEKVYADVTGEDKTKVSKKDSSVSTEAEQQPADKINFLKHRRYASPAVSEDAMSKSHEVARATKRNSFAYPKKGYGQKKYVRGRKPLPCDFPSGEGEGQHGSRTKAEDITPPETEGL